MLEIIIFYVLEFGFIFCYFFCILFFKGMVVLWLILVEFRYGVCVFLVLKIFFEMCVCIIMKGFGI